jgi:hypothetical protein
MGIVQCPARFAGFLGCFRVLTLSQYHLCLFSLLPGFCEAYGRVWAYHQGLRLAVDAVRKPPDLCASGEMNRKSPPPSKTFTGLSPAFAPLHFASVSTLVAMMPTSLAFCAYLSAYPLGARNGGESLQMSANGRTDKGRS